jgi:hypothetical protein
MELRARPPQLVAALILVASVVGYVLFVQSSHIDRTHLSSLVIEHTGVGALKPKPAESELVAPAKSSFAEMKKAWSVDPSQTGGYGKEWGGSTASGDAATQLIQLLPSSTEAKLVRSEAVAEYSDTKTLKAAHTTLTSRFTLPKVSGAFGLNFVTAKSTTTSAASGIAIVYRIGRVVAVEYVQSSTRGLTRADATTIADAEHALLERAEANFSMVVTSRPLWPSVIYVLATLALMGLVLIVPRWVHRRRIRHQARRNAQARYEYRARGGKALRRHRPPEWAQPARRLRSTR